MSLPESRFQQFEDLHSFFLYGVINSINGNLAFHKCGDILCLTQEVPVDGDTCMERWICTVYSKFVLPNAEHPDISPALFLLRIQRSGKQGREMGAMLLNIIPNSFNDNGLSYLPVGF